MLQNILRALARVIDTAFAVMRYPFQYLLGGLFASNTPPEFTPQESTGGLAERLTDERKNEIARMKDNVDTLVRYCNAEPSNRMLFDLTGFKPEVQDLLLGMDNNELRLLGGSPLNVLRKFAAGEDHGVEGIPRASVHVNKVEDKISNEVSTLKDMKKRLQAYASNPSPSY